MRQATLLRTGILSLIASGLLGCASEPLLEPSPEDSPSPSVTGSAAASDDEYALIEYPPGPYGSVVGSTMQNLEFLGWRDPVAAGYDPAKFEVIRMSDFYNPNGTRGDVKLLVLDASAVWCAVCKLEYRDLHDNGIYPTYRAKGVQLIGTLFEDNKDPVGPAKPEDLQAWGQLKYHQVAFPLLLDPGFKMGRYFDSDVVPLNMIVDASTMQILDITMGYDGEQYWPFVDTLLATR